MGDVRQWLAEQGLAQIADVFEREQIDWEALFVLSAADVKDLGLPIGARAKLGASLRALQSGGPRPPLVSSHGDDNSTVSAGDGERRQLTTLFCDVVGYTELTRQTDPENLQEAIRAFAEVCTRIIAKHDGHVFQIMGDGVMAFFGYPHAYEGVTARAVNTSLEIIEALSQREFPGIGRLKVRVGVATGMVVLTSSGTSPVGEAINLAARLQGIAKPGTVVVSGQARQLAGGGFQYVDLGEELLKGIAGPVRVYRVDGVTDIASRFDASAKANLTPMVGRRQEIDILSERWAEALAGTGHVAIVSGEPGIGKSRMLNTLCDQVDMQSGQTLRFQCSPYHLNSSLWPVAQCFEHLLNFYNGEAASAKLDKLEAYINAVHGLSMESVRFIAEMLSIPCEDRYGALQMTSQKQRSETLKAIVDLSLSIAEREQCVLLFEDVQWSDSSSLEMIDQLVSRVQTLPHLIIITHRPGFDERWPAEDHVSHVKIGKLSRDETVAMVTSLTGGKQLPDDLLERIIAKTDGVPLFVEELTTSVLESGQLREGEDCFEYSGTHHDVSIPATLRDLLMERLDRFSATKEIAQVGSAIGRTFTYELIAAVSVMPVSRLNEALFELVESGLATCRGAGPEATYTFKHALVHDTAYETMLKSRRQKLHSKIARVIEKDFLGIVETTPEVLARHLTLGGQSEAALPYWLKAGQQSLQQMALNEAISQLTEGLRLLGELPQSLARDQYEIALRRTLGVSWMATKGWAASEARESLLPAQNLIASAQKPRDMLGVFWGIWSNTLSMGHVQKTVDLPAPMFELAREHADVELEITAELMQTVSSFWLGDLDACATHSGNVIRLYEPAIHGNIANEINHDPRTGAGVYCAQVSWMLGHPDRAVEEFEANVAHAEARGHVFDIGFALGAGADLFEYRGEHEIQLAYIERCRQIGLDNSLAVLSEIVAPLRRGAALIRSGAFDEGLPLLQSSLQRREAGGSFGGSNLYLHTLAAEGLVLSGQLAKAKQVIERQYAQINRPGWGERSHFAEIRRVEGMMFERMGDPTSAETSYLQSLEWAREQRARSWELRTATSFAELLIKEGRSAEGRALLHPLFEAFAEGHSTRDLVHAREVVEALG